MAIATIANLVRAYIGVKTHPRKAGVRLSGMKLDERKEGYAAWQLLEERNRREDKVVDALWHGRPHRTSG